MKDKNFEYYYEKYIDISQQLEDDDLSLSKSLELYKESQNIYENLINIINQAKLEISEVNKEV